MKNNKLEIVYNYLLNNHLGAKNGITRDDLAFELNIPKRELRSITGAINGSNEYKKIISTKNNTYICDTKAECIATIKNSYKMAIAIFKKAKAMENKLALNGQVMLDLDDVTKKEIVEVFGE